MPRRLAALRPLGILIASLAVASVVVISRRPDTFTHAQFYAEDGRCSFADAYTLGPWQALFVPDQGHILMQPRLIALIAFPFGVASAPLIYNIFGLLFQIAPVAFFLSDRFRPVLPSIWWRAALCAVYLLIPSAELQVTAGNSQWHLAVLASLVLIAPTPGRLGWRVFDIGTLLLCALTGGFAYVLLPAALIWWWVRRQRWTGVEVAALGIGLVAQLYGMIEAARLHTSLVANLPDALRDLAFIGSDHIILAGLFGEEAHTHVFVHGLPHGAVLAAGICVVGLAVVVFAAIRAPWELRIFALIGFGIAAAGLASPLVPAGNNAWDVIAMAGDDRYFFMAELAWVVIILWALSRLPHPWLRAGGWALTAVAFASGLVLAWQYPPSRNYDWPQEAAQIVSAGSGGHVSVPIPPSPWQIIIPAPPGC